jgi:rhamnulose-1-phosphate aldolase/alcohol dehydrogenase
VTVVDDLLARSHALGADPTVTNYGGGNTSAKATAVDPATGGDVEVMWVKGSGGDLGTLAAEGLAALRVDRLRGLKRVYRGVEHEDEMVGLLAHCAFGGSGAAPSIDTAMHGLLPSAHVDHLHPDAVIALATAADGERLTKECFGEEIAWLPWRRPGFELGLQVEALHGDHRGVVLGGHGLTTWADASDACRDLSLEVIARAERFIAERGKRDPFGALVTSALPRDQRLARAAELAPVLRGLCSTDRRVVGHFTDGDVVLDFVGREAATRLVPLGTSCPDHLIRTKVRPLLVDGRDLVELHREYREEYAAYYRRHATASTPAMRGADPAVVLVPGVGMFSFGPSAREARIAGEFYLNAINVMRGAEALSTYAPISEEEKFRIEYWALEEAKLRRMPRPKPLAGRVALVTGGASGIGKAIGERLVAEGVAVVVADRDPVETVDPDASSSVLVDVTDERAVRAAIAHACITYGGVDIVVNNAGLSISKPLLETTVDDWDLQHDVMARGSFVVSREAAAALVVQGLGGDIVYVVSKNAVVAGPNNIAYGAAKADQAHQVRLLAAELGEHGIRVNGVNPDGVVRGSGIFASGWGADRAKVYGVPEEELGRHYAGRTLLKTEVLPEHVAAAVFALLAGDLSLTTGTIIPVDGGVPMGFLR